MEFHGQNVHEVYAAVVATTLELGAMRAPRGEKTRDLGFVSLTINDPRSSLLLGTRPNLNTRIAAIETLQIIGQFSAPDLVVAASANFARYREDTGHFHGAYGLRIYSQMGHVIRKLTDDPDTRQAVATIWDPFMDNQRGKRDYPCTVMLQFELRGGFQLCMNTVMRSNDVHLGLPYDIFQFTQLQQSVAHTLDVGVGPYRHTALSMHAYERDVEVLETVDVRNADFNAFQPSGIGQKNTGWLKIVDRAKQIAAGHISDDKLTRSEQWFSTRAQAVLEQMTKDKQSPSTASDSAGTASGSSSPAE